MTTPSPEGLQEAALINQIADIIAAKVSGPSGITPHIKTLHRLDQIEAARAILAALSPPAPADQGLKEALAQISAMKFGGVTAFNKAQAIADRALSTLPQQAATDKGEERAITVLKRMVDSLTNGGVNRSNTLSINHEEITALVKEAAEFIGQGERK